KNLALFHPGMKATDDNIVSITDLNDTALDEKVGERDAAQLREDAELIEGVYGELDTEAYSKGKVAPVFFGSAVNNFGVREMLDTFIQIAPTPLERPTNKGVIHPVDNKFSG